MISKPNALLLFWLKVWRVVSVIQFLTRWLFLRFKIWHVVFFKLKIRCSVFLDLKSEALLSFNSKCDALCSFQFKIWRVVKYYFKTMILKKHDTCNLCRFHWVKERNVTFYMQFFLKSNMPKNLSFKIWSVYFSMQNLTCAKVFISNSNAT